MERHPPEQLPLPLNHRVSLGAEDFLVADSNRLAADWISRWPEWPFTALLLLGPAGCGKTHLGRVWQARSAAISLTAADAGLEEIGRIAEAGRDVLLDDCDRAIGRPAAELALLQLYNLVRAAGGHLLLTAERPPTAWPILLPDLASRLRSAMVVPLEPPDDALLAAVAIKQLADRQLHISPDVIPILITRSERSFAGLSRSIDAIDRRALARRREITAKFARDVLQELDDADSTPTGA